MDTNVKVWFRQAQLGDAGFFVEVRDAETVEYLHDGRLYGWDDTYGWLASIQDSLTTVRHIVYINDTKVGIVRIDHIDLWNMNMMLGMDLHKNYRGKGYAKPIWKLLLDKVFKGEGMHAVYLEVLASNERAIHIYKKLGFKEDGRIPEKVLKNGVYIDSIHMSLLQKDWRNNE